MLREHNQPNMVKAILEKHNTIYILKPTIVANDR